MLHASRSPRRGTAGRPRGLHRLTVSVALLAVVAAGCGSDDAASDGGASVDAASAVSEVADAPTVTDAPATVPGDAAPATDAAEPAGTAAPATDAPATDAPSPAATGPLAFTAPLVGGGTFEGATYGQRPMVLWFWAPG